VVHVIIFIRARKNTLSGDISISGLPFTSDFTTIFNMVPYRRFLTEFQLMGETSGTSIILSKIDSDALTVVNLNDTDFATAATTYNNIGVSFSYFTS